MPAETTISTALPAGISEEAVISSLHSHELYIRTTCPQLISQKHVSGTPGTLGQPCAYDITDKRPIGQTTFRLTLTNVPGGVDAVVDGKAPTGAMTIRSQWRAREGRLEEVVEIDSNIVTKKFIKGNVEKGHPEIHHGFLAEAAKA
ncbi:hypothetical protein F5Y19DRAFT_480719 [Xylariaceae sp. FL1651]|nr:hypothetical protein F5Y19DRAFT_480719 [Xylariaceae sp. FL1651]